MTARTRQATIRRNTAETKIDLSVNLDGTGVSEINTGVAFFDHMLTLLSRHAMIDLKVQLNLPTIKLLFLRTTKKKMIWFSQK